MSDLMKPTPGIQAFTFGDAEPVLSGRGLLDYLECWRNGRWYEPPVNLRGLNKLLQAAVHHASAIKVKHNILMSTLERTPLLSRQDASRVIKEYLVLGNGYLEQVKTRGGAASRYRAAMGMYTRRGVDMETYWQAAPGQEPFQFGRGAIWHVFEPDLTQEVYGVPEYLASVNSLLLNESATLFRRRYYENGSHAGFILYVSDPAQDQRDIDAMREALKGAKGPGNFRNLFLYSPNGKKDGIQLIPVSEVAARDEFINIKNVSRDDQLAAHRIPWQLMGMPPASGVNYGDPAPVSRVFARNELKPLQQIFLEANEVFGDEVFKFGEYSLGESYAGLVP